MACSQELLELLSCYVDGEATPEEAARAEAHLDICPECKEIVQEWRHGIEMLDWTYSRALPENVAEPTLDPPTPGPEPVQSRWTFPIPDLRLLAAAAVLAFIALIGCTIYQQLIALPMLGRGLATARRAQTVLVAEGIRLEVEPDTEISRLGDKAVRLVQGTISAEVTHGRGFRIQTRKLEIIDEGTRFEVHSDSRTDRVTVKEGSVLVRKGKNEYPVSTGETLASTGDKLRNKTRLQGSEQNNMPSQPHGGVAIGSVAISILGIVLIVFWVKMLVNALTREFADSGTKIAWVLVILLGQLLGALIYHAVMYRNDPSAKQSWLTRPVKLPLVGRRGNTRVVIWNHVAIISAVMGIIAALATIAYHAFTSEWNAWVWLLVVIGTWPAIIFRVRSSMTAPIETLTDLDSDPPVSLRIPITRVLLVGRKGTQRVIQWWNVLVASVISVAVFGYGITQLTQETSMATLFVGAIVGIMFVVACIVQVLSYPLDVLTDLETGETPSQEVRNKRYPLPLLVGRRNGGRVIMWANISMLAAFATVAYSAFASDLSGSAGHGLPRIVGVYFGLIALMVLYALLLPLNKPSKLDDDPPTSRSRSLGLPLVGRRGDQRVILWWNVLVSAIILGSVSMLFYLWSAHEMSKSALIFGAICGIVWVAANIRDALASPLDTLTDLETGESPMIKSRRSLFTVAVRRNGKRTILWANINALAWIATIISVPFAFILSGNANLGLQLLIVAGVFFALVALMILYALLVPLDRLPSMNDDRTDE